VAPGTISRVTSARICRIAFAIHLNHGRIEATDDTGIPRSPGNRRSPIGTRTGVVERLASTSRAIVPLFFELRPLCA
jgi:hypothetical protein